ncbi:MAG: hypothetical protein ACLTAI_12740 [Thomasclavelia sp.]
MLTKRKDEIMAVYCKNFKHQYGMTVFRWVLVDILKEPVSMLTAIVSSYEVDDVIGAFC